MAEKPIITSAGFDYFDKKGINYEVVGSDFSGYLESDLKSEISSGEKIRTADREFPIINIELVKRGATHGIALERILSKEVDVEIEKPLGEKGKSTSHILTSSKHPVYRVTPIKVF